MNIAYDLLLLVFNVSQFRSRNKLIEIFIEGMTEMFQPAHFYYFEKSEGHKGLEIEVRTRSSMFGFVIIENENSLSEENKIIIINSANN